MERWTAPKLSLGCIFFCFLWNVSLSAILLFFLPTFLWSHPKLHLHPELTVDWAFPCTTNPPFYTPISTQRRAPCISYEEKFSWKPFLPPHSVLPALLSFLAVHHHVCLHLCLHLGGCKELLLFLWLAEPVRGTSTISAVSSVSVTGCEPSGCLCILQQ